MREASADQNSNPTGQVDPCRVNVVCSGSPFEMGLAQGEALREKIRLGYGSLGALESLRARKPRWLPLAAFLWLAERRAARYLGRSLAEAPDFGRRIDGISRGAGLRRSAVAMMNAIEPILSSMASCTARVGDSAAADDSPAPEVGPSVAPVACSAVAVRGARSASGAPIIARNFDYMPVVQPFFALRSARPARGLRSLEFTTAPMAGALDGMNEHGLAITYNYAYAVDRPTRPGPPISVLIAEALATRRTVAEAAEHITARSRTGGALLMLADAEGDIASLELSNTRSHLRRPAAGEDFVFHTNAFSSDAMRAVQVPANAVYAVGAPAPMRGRRLHESAECRDARIAALVEATPRFGPDELQSLLADHGPEGRPSELSPCVHGAVWSTSASLQFFPRERRIRVAYASTCSARYSSFNV